MIVLKHFELQKQHTIFNNLYKAHSIHWKVEKTLEKIVIEQIIIKGWARRGDGQQYMERYPNLTESVKMGKNENQRKCLTGL